MVLYFNQHYNLIEQHQHVKNIFTHINTNYQISRIHFCQKSWITRTLKTGPSLSSFSPFSAWFESPIWFGDFWLHTILSHFWRSSMMRKMKTNILGILKQRSSTELRDEHIEINVQLRNNFHIENCNFLLFNLTNFVPTQILQIILAKYNLKLNAVGHFY